MCACAYTHGHIYATLAIVKEQDLKPEDIAAVRIKAGARQTRHTTTLSKKYPRNAESADHSAFYGNALAIKERAFGPDSIKPEGNPHAPFLGAMPLLIRRNFLSLTGIASATGNGFL